MSIYIREKCSTPNCNRMGRNKGLIKGVIYYAKKCDVCHRGYDRTTNGDLDNYGISSIPNKKCQVCSWDKAPCDRHKLIPQEGYTKENVIILCPNCHRLETLGLLKLDNIKELAGKWI